MRRFNFLPEYCGTRVAEMDERKDGDFVLFDDHVAEVSALRADNKRLDDERLEALVQASDAQQRVGQLENELAEYQDKPEAFERLRELLRKERSMRKQESKRFLEVCDERNTAQTELEVIKKQNKALTTWCKSVISHISQAGPLMWAYMRHTVENLEHASDWEKTAVKLIEEFEIVSKEGKL